jgi:hypothetical protein
MEPYDVLARVTDALEQLNAGMRTLGSAIPRFTDPSGV